MSVLFLPPPSASAIPDASETVSGKIRIATSAEATAGTNDLTAMTPLKVKSVVDAAVVGGVTYKGTFDAAAPLDLSNAEQGDLYVIDGAGTYQGQTWAVGDHLLVNADMGGTVSPSKIDKIDSTDSVTSVAGRTGAVTLSTADISGLATVASTGAYSDLTGTPTLATVATTGAYSDLSGTPTLGTAAALDVGTSASNIVQLNGSAQLPAVDGSLLTGISASIAALNDVGDVNAPTPANTNVIKYNSTSGDWESGAVAASEVSGLATVATTGAYSDLSGTPTLATVATTGAYSDLSGTPTLGTAAALDVGTSATNVVQLDGSARLPAVDGSQLTNLPSGASTLGALTDVDVTGAVNTNVLKYNSTSGNWEDGAVAYSEVTGTPTLATVATTGAYSDLTGTPTLATVATTGAYSDLTGTPTLGTAAALDVGTSATNVVQLDGSARLPAVDGSQLTNLPSGASTLGALTDVTLTSAADGQFLKYDSTSGDWVNGNSGLYEAYTFTTTGTVATPDQPKTIAARLSSSTAQTLTLPTGSSDLLGSTISLTNINAGTWTISAAAGQYIRGLSSAPTLTQDQALILTLVFDSVWYVVAYEEQGLGSLADVSITSPSNGEALIYNSTTGDWENGTPSASVAALNDIGDVSAPTPANTNVIKYNSTSGDWESGAVAASEVSGLATVATTGAYSDLSGTPTLATVATTGAYSDLTGTPTLGTAAALDVGTSANNVVQLNGSAQLPAVDGSLLTGITATVAALNDIGDVSAAAPTNGQVIAYNSTSGDWEAADPTSAPASVTVSSPSTDQTLTAPSGIEEVYVYTPSTTITVNLASASSCGVGFKYQIKNASANTITIDPNGTETIDGASTFALSTQYASVTIVTDGSNWFII